ncbi:MAG: PorT family protein, partial [Prevotella salivae]|nr:PorT family protein [Segatella salivae]
VDADPQDELNHKKIYKNFDFGIQPGVYYQTGKHWRFGVQAHIGFCDMLKKYPEVNDSKRLNDVAATVNFSF